MGIERRDMTGEEVADLVDHLVEVHPDFTGEDLYKLAHQAVLGCGHLLAAEHIVRSRLLDEVELAGVVPKDWEEPVEVIHPGVSMVRVHLRPYLRSGGGIDRLIEAMFETQALLGEPDHQGLARLLGALRAEVAGRDPVPIKLKAFDLLLKEQVTQGFTPVHHSEGYRFAYGPHYRVVLLDAMAS